jgi:23S rRNA (cytidine1920-2'-O)/16S rRNA (cytidine1409-2'-O)-methyltransferase
LTRRRLDAEIVRRGLVSSRAEAEEAVRSGRVTVSGVRATKSSTLVDDASAVVLGGHDRRYASRAGIKLAAAIERFGIDVSGRMCLDAGASTGGFTDCLLQAGAARVLAVDVGYGQLAWELRTDDRVTVWERTNVRTLTPEAMPFAPDLVVADLSFISLRLVLPTLTAVANRGADLITLVKPQFEARPEQVGSGGVVRDPRVWREVLDAVVEAGHREDLAVGGAMASPLPGPAGNVEFLLHLCRGQDGDVDAMLVAAVGEGEAVAS